MISAKVPTRDEIETVLLDDELYDRLADDLCPPKQFFNDLSKRWIFHMEGIVYIGGYVKGEIASLFVVHGDLLHFMVLKKYRPHASELLKVSLKEWPGRVIVKIPTLYRSVINFARKHGFQEKGIEHLSYVKNGQRYDRHILMRGA